MAKKQNQFYDPRIINLLDEYLLDHASILKIGAKTCSDLAKLDKHYQVTGSVFSSSDAKNLQVKHPDLNIKAIDIHSPTIKNNYDCIYSNKALATLTPSKLAEFLTIQADHLKEDGMILLTLPYNKKKSVNHADKKYYYTEKEIEQLIPESLRIDLLDIYFDQVKNDSLLIVLKKRS